MDFSAITITDADIDEIESILGNVSFDAERRDILKNLSTVDIQAFPGTGKTTVLVAKLAILAKKWPYSHKGICVLSHTNVAREEIETRLGDTPLGKKLLSYPHFIGTIHSFANTFLALPYLRSKGYPISLIDTEITLEKRFNRLHEGTLKFFERKHFGKNKCELTDYPKKIDINCNSESDSYKDVIKSVDDSFNYGYFTYNESLFISRYVLQNKCIVNALQERFPLVLIDEAQDTNSLQWEIIRNTFCRPESKTVIQKYGDANQAIYESLLTDDSTMGFPADGYLQIRNSLRFGGRITSLINPLAVVSGGAMTGDNRQFDKNDNKHSIILFDDSDIEKVLPAFGSIVLDAFDDEELKNNACYGIHAIGMVHKRNEDKSDPKKFPFSVKDYFPRYDSTANRFQKTPNNLIDFFRISSVEYSNSYISRTENIAKGIRHILHTFQPKLIPFKRTAFNSLCQYIAEEQRPCFRKEFKEIVDLPYGNEIEWNAVVDKIQDLCIKWFIDISRSNQLMWNEDNRTEHKAIDNVFEYSNEKTGRSVTIEIGSIHSQKGKTHLATLVLETFWNDPNISHILDWITDQHPKKAGKRDFKRLKCHFVALSRAKGLICIALPKKLVDENRINQLTKAGWTICKI